MRLKCLQTEAVGVIRHQTRLDVTSEDNLFPCHDTRSVNPGEAVGLTHRLVRVSLWVSQRAVLPLEDWRKAHTPPAKLAA